MLGGASMFNEFRGEMTKDRITTYFAVVVVSAFLGEMVIMVILDVVQLESKAFEVLVDAVFISALLLLITHRFMLRPFFGTLTALHDARERYRSVIDAAGDSIFVVDSEGRIVEANRAACSVLRSEGHELYHRKLTEFLRDDEGQGCAEFLASGIEKSGPTACEAYLQRRDGQSFPVNVRMGHVVLGENSHDHTVVLASDITGRKNFERQLRDQNRMLQTLVDAIPAPIFFKDENFLYLGCNRAFEAFIGIEREDLVGKGVYEIAPRELADTYYEADRKLFEDGGEQIYETGVQYADGSQHDVEFRKAVFRGDDGAKAGIIGVMLDVSDRKKLTEELRYRSCSDPVTDLSNRTHFQEQLTDALRRAKRNQSMVAVLFVGLDGFGDLRRGKGHAVGDMILREVAERLKVTVRESDIAARVGGESFSVIVENPGNFTAVTLVAGKVLEALGQPYQVNGTPIQATASMGISIYPDSCEDPDQLLIRAEEAALRVSERGGNGFHIWT